MAVGMEEQKTHLFGLGTVYGVVSVPLRKPDLRPRSTVVAISS